MAMVELPINP